MYGENSSASPPVPGMRPGETIDFRVNGRAATSLPPVLWQEDFEPIQADLAAGNAIPVEEALASLTLLDGSPAYDLVLGEFGIHATSPAYPGANTLAALEAGRGYLIRMKAVATLTLAGRRLPADTPIPLAHGWRWIGYLPGDPRDLPAALHSIAGKYDYLLGETGTYSPLAPPFLNTISSMGPGRGYLARMQQGGSLVFGP